MDCLLPLAATSRQSAAVLCEKLTSGRRRTDSEFDDDVALPFSKPEYLYRHGLNYLTYRQIDFRNVARTVRHQTLLISTESDSQVPLRSSQLIAGLMANKKQHITLPGDHYELLRGGAEVVGALSAFLGKEAA